MTIIIAIVVAIVAFTVGYVIARARPPASSTTPAHNSSTASAAPTIERVSPSITDVPPAERTPPAAATATTGDDLAKPSSAPAIVASQHALPADDHAVAERARVIRSYENEAALLRRTLAGRDAMVTQLGEFSEERRRLFVDLAAAHAETARYRQVIVDLEDNAAPQFFGAGAPDDLKLIVGIGPVLERMLQMMGVATYRQIARWTERDIDEFDARLHEFPGRIRRDAWVTQARALHQSKYGEALPLRGRG